MHIQKDSPCIDAGDENTPDGYPFSDFENEYVYDANEETEGVRDIGADEWRPESSPDSDEANRLVVEIGDGVGSVVGGQIVQGGGGGGWNGGGGGWNEGEQGWNEGENEGEEGEGGSSGGGSSGGQTTVLKDIDCPGNCSKTYWGEVTVRLEAIPAKGYAFDHFDGIPITEVGKNPVEMKLLPGSGINKVVAHFKRVEPPVDNRYGRLKDPVNTSTGEYYFAIPLFDLGGPIPLVFDLFYSSFLYDMRPEVVRASNSVMGYTISFITLI